MLLGDFYNTAYESPVLLGTNIRELTLPPNDAIGQRAYDAVANSPEGTIVTMDYELPKPGTKMNPSTLVLISLAFSTGSPFSLDSASSSSKNVLHEAEKFAEREGRCAASRRLGGLPKK